MKENQGWAVTLTGNIGEAILERFNTVVVDYPRSRMILEPGPDVGLPFAERRSFGMTLLSDGPEFKSFQVTAVGANAPAARAGFQKGDVITAVDSTPASELTLGKLRDILTLEGSRHEFTVLRKSEEIKIPVTIELVPISGLK